MSRNSPPTPLFDDIESLEMTYSLSTLTSTQNRDFQQARQFLLCYKKNKMTFNAYRREIERFLQWCFCKSNKSLKQLRRNDIEAYIQFCIKPLKSWVGLKKVARFKLIDGVKLPNKDWKPFVATVSKSKTMQGQSPSTTDYILSEKSLREIFTVTTSFFNYIIQEDYVKCNPVLQIRQRNQYFTKQQSKRVIRKLSELQWGYVIETARKMAEKNSDHERTLFIISALYGMYLRISELAANDRWAPTMVDFYRDADGLWLFKTVGKGNKERHIAVSQDMLKALKRWRRHLGLTPLPSPGESAALIPKRHGSGPMASTRTINMIVQECFNKTIERLKADGFNDDGRTLMNATVHWLRHTGISDDVKIRPREHVRDDTGHSSSSITDKYIDVETRERYQSAKKKHMVPAGFDVREADESCK